MNFLNIFEDHVAGIFGATRAPFSFKKLAKQAARDMEDQTLVINGVNTAPALYTILIAADDDPMLAPFYPELSREVREFVKAQAEKRRYVFVGEPLVRFMIDPQLRGGKFSVFAENVDAPTLGRLYEEERAYQNGLGQNNSAASSAAATRAPVPNRKRRIFGFSSSAESVSFIRASNDAGTSSNILSQESLIPAPPHPKLRGAFRARQTAGI